MVTDLAGEGDGMEMEMEMRRFAVDPAYPFPSPCSLLLIGADFVPACLCRYFPAGSVAAAFGPACPCFAVVGLVDLYFCLIAGKAMALGWGSASELAAAPSFSSVRRSSFNELVIIFRFFVLRLELEGLLVMLERIGPVG